VRHEEGGRAVLECRPYGIGLPCIEKTILHIGLL
jgi:hypothetical protein